MNVEGNKTNVYRTANFIRKPNHPLWQLKNASEVKSYLEMSFPQIDWNRFVSNEVKCFYIDLVTFCLVCKTCVGTMFARSWNVSLKRPQDDFRDLNMCRECKLYFTALLVRFCVVDFLFK